MSQPSYDLEWEILAKKGDLKGAILDYVRGYDWTTFVEIQNKFEPYFEVRGDVAIEPFENGLVWMGMSEEFATAINDLLNQKKLFLHPASPTSYMIDGGMPTYPVGKRMPTKGQGHKSPHWLPFCLRVVPYSKGAK